MNIVKNLCQACATGNTKKHKHNFDENTCELGMMAKINAMPDKEAIRELRILKRISIDVATTIVGLARTRNKPISMVMEEEGFEKSC